MASTIAAAKSSPPNSSPSPATPPSHTIAAILQYTRSAPSSAQRVLTTAEPRRSSTSPPALPREHTNHSTHHAVEVRLLAVAQRPDHAHRARHHLVRIVPERVEQLVESAVLGRAVEG
jgi:hypothetical protein